MMLYEKLRAYRLKSGVTQTHVAKTMKMSVKTLNAIELGRQKLSVDLFEDICRRGLSVNPALFFLSMKSYKLRIKANKIQTERRGRG